MNKKELETLSDEKLEDARVLLESKRYCASYYMAGYAVECAIKACIAKKINRYDFPDKKLANKSHSHNFNDLIAAAELKAKLDKELEDNKDFYINWSTADNWSVENRYELSIEEKTAEDMYHAIANKKSGVLQWLKQYW